MQNFFYPLNEALRHRQTVGFLNAMQRLERLRPAQVQERQFEKLQCLLVHARRSVPYYRRLMQERDFNPEHMQTPHELAALPILTKVQIRSHQRDLLSEAPAAKLIRNCTSGSSGQPLQFYSDAVREAALNAAKWRGRHWWGHRIGDREVCVWGWGGLETNKWYRALVRRKDHLLNYFFLDSMRLDAGVLAALCRRIAQFRPEALYGFPSSLAALAQHLRDHPHHGFRREHIRPRVIISTGETLYPHQREVISEVFQCGIAREYGSHDGGLVAFDCPAGRLHLMADHVYLEILPEPANAKSGTLLITNLDGYGMPFIRYDSGDLGELDEQPCACGLPLPLLQNFEGRKLQSIALPDGATINGLYFTGVLRNYTAIRAFKVLQKSDYRVIVFIVPADSFTNAHQQEITQKFSAFLTPQVPITIELVDALPFTAAGKLLLVESEILKAPALDHHRAAKRLRTPEEATGESRKNFQKVFEH